MKLPMLSANQSLKSSRATVIEVYEQYIAGLLPQAGGSKRARLNKDYKTGRIGNRANASVKVPSGEEEDLLEECFENALPEGYSTWHEYFKLNEGTSLVTREYLIKLCQDLMGRTMY